ncbi:MAG: hypothetical protein JXB00_09735 [Bacteroidales bacterium]|nr:hypothetical protein [Bacteroidales bacterium]
MKSILFLFSVLTFFSYSFGQQPLQIRKGRINTTNGELIKFSNLHEEGGKISFTKPGQTGEYSLNLDDVLKIDKKSGDHTLQFALIMGASGLLGGIIGYKISEASLQPGYAIDKKASTRNVVILTGISAFAGAIWGANLPKYETAYENPKYSSLLLRNLKVHLAFGNTQQIGIIYKF